MLTYADSVSDGQRERDGLEVLLSEQYRRLWRGVAVREPTVCPTAELRRAN